jgi:hypothetical protein
MTKTILWFRVFKYSPDEEINSVSVTSCTTRLYNALQKEWPSNFEINLKINLVSSIDIADLSTQLVASYDFQFDASLLSNTFKSTNKYVYVKGYYKLFRCIFGTVTETNMEQHENSKEIH